MKIGLGQIGSWVGDLEGNVARCLHAIERAAEDGADLVVLPELALPGYPPRDILCDEGFAPAIVDAGDDLAARCRGLPPTIVGSVAPGPSRPLGHPGLHNVALLIAEGRVRDSVAKRLIPSYDVFHEARWFLSGAATQPIAVAGRKLGVTVCEDMWDEHYALHPPEELRKAGAAAIVNISASPYRRGVLAERLRHARRARTPFVYVNGCGATDELVFDGRSFVLDADGKIVALLPGFEEAVVVVDLDASGGVEEPAESLGDLHRALVLGIRDFATKNAIRRAFLGLSGGIDSAFVARLAVDALGADQVTAIAIPSRFTDARSTDSARELAGTLGVGFEVVPLEPMHTAAEQSLRDVLERGAETTAAENVQARLRALVLMSYVNAHGGLLLNTSNKTELSLGYATLYGDMAGTLCPIADLTKPDVVELAAWLGGFPEFILERPPTAELKEDQRDPFDYPVLAPEIEKLVASNRSDAALRRSEHKRWQMGVVLKVSEKAFGTGRLIPITRK